MVRDGRESALVSWRADYVDDLGGYKMAEIYVLFAIIVLFVAFTGWREVEHRKQVDLLTSKLISRSYAEYATYKPVEDQKVEKKDKPKKKVNDPVLGEVY